MVIYQRNRKEMFRAAYRVLGDHSLAEDALQEAFLAIAQRIDRIRDPESRETMGLCCSVAKNKAVDLLRKVSREVAVPPEDIEASCLAEEDHVAYTLALLPQELRDVLLLRYDCGYSAAEIGKFLGLSASQVRRRITEAKKRLYGSPDGGESNETRQ